MANDGSNWIDRANSFSAGQGKQYDWVWEYAKFRLEFTFSNGRHLEEKALNLTKFVLAVAAAASAGFSYVVREQGRADVVAVGLIFLAAIFLLLSAFSGWRAYDPERRLLPYDEARALDIANDSSTKEEALARFSLAMADSTEYESKLTVKKAQLVRKGSRYALAATLLFTLCLLWEVFRRTCASFCHWAG
jgi:hypothetical protein